MANTALKSYMKTEQDKTLGTAQVKKAAKGQKKNNAGGYTFVVNDVNRLTRFLVLGTEGGTFYVGQRDLTKQNVDFIVKMIKKDEASVLNTVVSVSDEARAPKNSYALFVLALVFKHGADKKAASDALVKVARTGTHLFEFVSYLKGLGGLGRSKQRAIANWYLTKTPEQVAFQAVKYRSRNGFTHADLFKLSHPVGFDKEVGNFILGREYGDVPEIISAYAQAAKATSLKDAKAVIESFPKIPWEAFPTSLHSEAGFWKALFKTGNFGATALLRNVTRWAKLGLFDDVQFAGDVAKALADPKAIAKGRLHPVQYLNALFIYQKGRLADNDGWGGGHRVANGWKVNAKIAGALEKGYYAAFKNIEPSGKRTMVSVDVSGSMTWGAPAGIVGLNYLEAAAAMAQVTVRTEDYVVVNAFSHRLVNVDISDADSLDQVITKFRRVSMGSTNVSAPIEYAINNNLEIDTFVVYTDNETYSGRRHPHEALKAYREKTGIPAKLIVVGMAGTKFTVADPNDAGMLDVVGFDSAAPGVMADFSAGRI
jgi:60 kDa SS-A/Ro ribonucleoprotein